LFVIIVDAILYTSLFAKWQKSKLNYKSSVI